MIFSFSVFVKLHKKDLYLQQLHKNENLFFKVGQLLSIERIHLIAKNHTTIFIKSVYFTYYIRHHQLLLKWNHN